MPEGQRKRILLAEDDGGIARSLREFLAGEGFDVCAVAGQADAERRLRDGGFDLLLADIALADGSGYGACADAKKRGLPVIFLTASGDEGSVVAGLDMGADDYVSKPFRPRELASRIRSVLRRYDGAKGFLPFGDLLGDTEKGVVTRDGAEVPLSALEYRILLVFANNRGKLLTRARLLEEIWDVSGDFVNDNTLTVYIKRLREKIERDPQEPTLIRTVRGIGYRSGE